MGARRILTGLAAVVATVLVALIGWDALKLSGRGPSQAAAGERATAILVDVGTPVEIRE